MRKNFILKVVFVFLFGLYLSAETKAQLFSTGDRMINLGIGVPNYLGGQSYHTNLPLISGSFDYGIIDDLIDGKASISVGGYLGYTANQFKFTGNQGYDNLYLILGPKATFHYNFFDTWEAYGGLLLGYTIVSSSSYGSIDGLIKPDNVSRLIPSIYAGARYYFAYNLSAFAELGYGISAINVGISFKF